MTRDELIKMPCWLCWWREGSRCYSSPMFDLQVTLGNVDPDDGIGALNPSVEIHRRLPVPLVEVDDEKSCMDFQDKRRVLEQYFDDGFLVIASEAALGRLA